VVIAVAIVGVVQVAVHQVTGVVPVGYGFVPAAGPVYVVGRMAAADVAGSATVGIFGGNFDSVVLYGAALLLMMQVAVVEIVDVVAMLNGGVAAAFAVIMIVMIALMIVSHSGASPGK